MKLIYLQRSNSFGVLADTKEQLLAMADYFALVDANYDPHARDNDNIKIAIEELSFSAEYEGFWYIDLMQHSKEEYAAWEYITINYGDETIYCARCREYDEKQGTRIYGFEPTHGCRTPVLEGGG